MAGHVIARTATPSLGDCGGASRLITISIFAAIVILCRVETQTSHDAARLYGTSRLASIHVILALELLARLDARCLIFND